MKKVGGTDMSDWLKEDPGSYNASNAPFLSYPVPINFFNDHVSTDCDVRLSAAADPALDETKHQGNSVDATGFNFTMPQFFASFATFLMCEKKKDLPSSSIPASETMDIAGTTWVIISMPFKYDSRWMRFRWTLPLAVVLERHAYDYPCGTCDRISDLCQDGVVYWDPNSLSPETKRKLR